MSGQVEPAASNRGASRPAPPGLAPLTGPQQAAAVDRVGENIALLSGAGCGKTYVLARRYTELLMAAREQARPDQDNPLSRFVALTYTDKAALEMSQRVRKMLKALAAGATEPAERRRLLGWLQELPEARISTIHSFCASLLRTYAVEAGIDPGFSVCADQMVSDMMIAESADRALLEAVEAGRQDAAGLVDVFGYGKAVSLVRQLVQWRTEWRPEDYADPDRILARWESIRQEQLRRAHSELAGDKVVLALLEEAEGPACSDPADKLEALRGAMLPGVREVLASDRLPSAELVSSLTGKPGNVGSARAWGGADTLVRARRAMATLADRMRDLLPYTTPLNPLDRRAAEALAAVARLAHEADSLYAAQKRRRGQLDFTDLLAAAGRLLADRPELRDAIGGQIDQLLVDEAQDTSGFQIELLANVVFAGRGGGPLPEGRLFLVGDAKQSIYRFRGAEVEAFEDLCRRLGASHQERLSKSFRTHQAGVDFVNRLFEPLMGGRYEPIEAHRQGCPPHPSVEIIVARPPAGGPGGAGKQAGREDGGLSSAEEAVSLQAAAVAGRIARMTDQSQRLVWDGESNDWRPVGYRDVAILLARMTKSLPFERALADAGIPYYVVGGTGFFEQQEVYDVLNALRAIDNPLDDVALVGFLRSGMVGLDDNSLMSIAEAAEPPYWPRLRAGLSGGGDDAPRARVAGLSDEQAEALGLAVDLIAGLRGRKNAVGIDELIGRLLDETGYEAALLCRPTGRRMLGNVRQLMEQARSATEAGMALADFIAQADELTVNEARYEQASVAAESDDVVRLMTIHKAKGLEFPVVIIPDLNATRQSPKGPLLKCPPWGLTCKLQNDQHVDEEAANELSENAADAPVSYRLARLAEQAQSRAEDMRKMYVAATRHEDHLIFVGADWRQKTGEFRPGGCFLADMDRVLGLTAALDRGQQSISYGPAGRKAALLRAAPSLPRRRGRRGPAFGLLETAGTGRDLAEGIVRLAAGEAQPPLLGPIPPSCGKTKLAVTALADFEHCPMLYRWRHELRVPAEHQHAGGQAGNERAGGPARARQPGPAQAGTLFHRCMELLDFSEPQPTCLLPAPLTSANSVEPPRSVQAADEQALALVGRALSEMDLDEAVDPRPLADELRAMLEGFRRSELFGRIAAAKQVLRELAFLADTPSAALTGQIDLLFQAEAGWEIVDYKSDRVEAGAVAEYALRYRTQMMCYAAAAAAHLGEAPVAASLYFLRPGCLHVMPLDAGEIQAARRRIDDLAARFLSARRSGDWRRAEPGLCAGCPYALLCRRRPRG